MNEFVRKIENLKKLFRPRDIVDMHLSNMQMKVLKDSQALCASIFVLVDYNVAEQLIPYMESQIKILVFVQFD